MSVSVVVGGLPERGAFTSYRGASTVLLILSILSVLTLPVDVRLMMAVQMIVCLGAAVVVAVVAVSRRPRPLWPTILLAISQVPLALQALIYMFGSEQASRATYALVGVSSLLQLIAWARLAKGSGVGWNAAAVLDTAVLLVGLLGSAAILGAPKYVTVTDESATAVQNLSSVIGVALIMAVAFGGLVRRPTPPAYQILLLGLTFSVALRIVQAYYENQGVNIADEVSQTAIIVVSLATAGAVVDRSYLRIGQATKVRTRSWSVPRAAALLGVAMMPVWAAIISPASDSTARVALFVCLIVEMGLLLTRAVVAGRAEERSQQERLHSINVDPVVDLPTARGLVSTWVEGQGGPSIGDGASIVRIWLDDIEDLWQTAGRRFAGEVERAWSRRLIANLPTSASTMRMLTGQYVVVLYGRSTEQALSTVQAALGGGTVPISIDDETLQIRSAVAASPLPDFTQAALDEAVALAGIARRVQESPPIGSAQLRERWTDRVGIAQEILSDTTWAGLDIRVQPFIDPRSNEIIGFECLSSWTSPTRGRVRTDEFFEIVNGLTLEAALDVTIVTRALAWPGPGGHPGILSVNINPQTLIDSAAFTRVLEAHQTRAWRDSTVWLEIVESDLRSESSRLSAMLGLLSAEGMCITVDDFGAGSSTLTRLADFHISVIKLDRALVDGIADDQNRREIVKSMIDLSGRLGMQMVAEGIESQTDAAVLVDMGCPIFQGYYWSAGTSMDAAPRVGSVIEPAIAMPLQGLL